MLGWFWHQVKGRARVLPFGKPERHVSTTEPDRETVKMVEEVKEETVRGGGAEVAKIGIGLNGGGGGVMCDRNP